MKKITEGELEGDSKENFLNCFEDEDDILAVLAIMMSLEIRILFGDHEKPKSQQLHH